MEKNEQRRKKEIKKEIKKKEEKKKKGGWQGHKHTQHDNGITANAIMPMEREVVIISETTTGRDKKHGVKSANNEKGIKQTIEH